MLKALEALTPFTDLVNETQLIRNKFLLAYSGYFSLVEKIREKRT